MSKKHFESAALAIRNILASDMPDKQARAEGAAAIIIQINDNPRFDSRRFLTACGIVK
jgi:hypothetical protein